METRQSLDLAFGCKLFEADSAQFFLLTLGSQGQINAAVWHQLPNIARFTVRAFGDMIDTFL